MTDANTGAVIIGRNEGQRLVRCLASIVNQVAHAVYVDSGSTDNSIADARAAGVEVVDLDMSLRFSAARARNTGFEALRRARPDLTYVQFVDGDCEVQSGWLGTARQFLDAHPQVAVACGRRRERFPEASVYNRLCDREWDTPIGRTKSCGGDALMRADAFEQAGGYNPAVIAGEEPELCVRLRQAGWEIWRLDAEMTLHDAAITRPAQWWKRSRRTGHAWAQGMAMHGRPPECHGVKQTLRALAWGAILPLVILALFVLTGPFALLLGFIYAAQAARLALRGNPASVENWRQAILMTIIKFPEAAGVLDYWLKRMTRRPPRIIEYK